MTTTINLLSAADSLVRFPEGTSINQSPQYLNNGTSPRFSWTAENASITAVSNLTKLPSCNSLLVTPTSAADVFIRLNDVSVPGTVNAGRSPLNYLFHCLILSTEPALILTQLREGEALVDPKSTRLVRDQFTPCRSNRFTFDTENNIPSSLYLGSDPLMDIQIQVSEHNNIPFYLTFPALIDEDAWKYNSVVSSSLSYIPTVFRDVDEVQDPEYPFFKLIDVLSHRMGDASQIYSDWFRFEPDELPSEALETDIWVRSQLTDATIAGQPALEWDSNVIGRRLIKETYAVNPDTASTEAWQEYSYPLDMTHLIQVDTASALNYSIASDLVAKPRWDPVRTASTNNIDISTSLINGSTIGGVVVSTGDRVLLRHQTSPLENGLYFVAASGPAIRTYDSEASGHFEEYKTVEVLEGTFGGTYWEFSYIPSFTLGTDPVIFNQSTSPGVVEGFDLEVGSKVLLLNQNNPTENGVWEINGPVAGSSTRTAALNSSSEFINTLYIEVTGEGRYLRTLWRLLVERPIVLGEDPIQIIFVDRKLDYLRSQVSTAMYGHAAGSYSSLRNTAKRFLTGTRNVVIDPNIPNQYEITVRTLFDETVGVDPVDVWDSCIVATTLNLDLATELSSGSVVDGIVVNTSNRVLVKNQNSANENGIYVVQSSGAAFRAADANEVSEFTSGKSVYIQFGDANGESYYTVTNIPTTIGVSDIEFSRTSTLGSSDVILQSLEPARPLGYVFKHETIHRFSFTLDSPALGRLGGSQLA